MPIDFTHTLVIGVSSRALFDLEKENQIFQEQGVEAYAQYQLDHEGEILAKGTAFPLVEQLLAINQQLDFQAVEVVVMSRNSPDTGLRILESIEHYNLPITRSAFSGGEELSAYLEAFQVDLFLTRSAEDVQAAIDANNCAALTYDVPNDYQPDTEGVRFAFDADAVVFSDESERIYKEQGLEAFWAHEKLNRESPMNEGPFAKLIQTLARLQAQLGPNSPIRIAIVTARNSPAHLRVIKTLRRWNVAVDAAFFLGGMAKQQVLKAYRPHIFFDDQELHVQPASKVVPSSKVPYRSDSPLNK